ncbi:MAG TPA: DNA polymerase [Phycisphaerae bacterium]|nr:DNA polymerase [Phycisphaerae bacterium]HRY66847.1 DNA polymerase [Phycisphaerae bacterium]HSA26905.1 DNA polymerase [Phycisphaerae bacterium]
MNVAGNDYREVWVVDFEFTAPAGERPGPVCMVARELASGELLRVWQADLLRMRRPPYAIDKDSLFVAYYASAEFSCHLVLGWPLPANVLDLFAEFRCATNGLATTSGSGLLGALVHYGLDAIGITEKERMRALALRGGPYTQEEKIALLDYCQSDVDALAKLLPCMMPHLDMPRALLRGQYMVAAALIEHVGVSIDTEMLTGLRERWAEVQDSLIARIDADYHVYDGRSFREDRWAGWLVANDIPWPRLTSGRLALDDDTFRQMARTYPKVSPIRELRVSLSQMRLADLAVGADGRNRYLLSAFRARTSRNQPSNSRSIFGPSVWLRGLIKPEPGWGMAYVDWAQQEFGIAAALSGDTAMCEAYASGDPYLTFAKQAGAVPAYATKVTHGLVREQYKTCALAVQYGMAEESLAVRIGRPVAEARELLRTHHRTFSRFWSWSDSAVDYAMLHGRLHTVFGWQIQVGPDANARSLANFPMQANGAEMLRLACIYLTQAGIRVCAPVHDALLVEGRMNELDDVVRRTQDLMAKASEDVLGGFRLRSDAKLIRHPDRYADGRGLIMWDTVQRVLEDRRPTSQVTHDNPGFKAEGVLCNATA